MKNLNYYKNLEYSFRVDPDPEGGFVASIPDLSGCYSFGETKQEAIARLDEAKNIWLESYYNTHGEAPEPSKEPEFSGRFLLRLPKYLHRRLYEGAKMEGISLNQYIVYLLAARDTRAELARSVSRQLPVDWSSIAFLRGPQATTDWTLIAKSSWLSFAAEGERKQAATSELFLRLIGNLIVPKLAGKKEEIKPWKR